MHKYYVLLLIFTITTNTLIARTITFWIHGTRPSTMIPFFLRIFTDNIEHQLFATKKKPGTHKASTMKDQEYIYQTAIDYTNETKQNLDDFYVVCWSGKLDPIAREEEAKKLFSTIENIGKKYEIEDGIFPIIDIIAHSHGGNVSLLLSKFATFETKFSINKLILLACPVQKFTEHLIRSSFFKNIYNIHSHDDWTQILDPQGVQLLGSKEIQTKLSDALFKNLFSDRHFSPQDNLKQLRVTWAKDSDQNDKKLNLFPFWFAAQIKFNAKLPFNRGLNHLEFVMLPFIRHLPEIIRNTDKNLYKKIDTHDFEVILK